MACLSQDNADQQDHSGVHCTDQCAKALMQESRVAEAGTQGLEAKLASAVVKRKSVSEQLAREWKDWVGSFQENSGGRE